MAAIRKLIISLADSRNIYASAIGGALALSPFFQSSVVPIRIRIMEPNPASPKSTMLDVDTSNISVSFRVVAALTGTAGDYTPFVQQLTWTRDSADGTFFAYVSFNTADLNTWLGASDEKTAYLEICISEGTTSMPIFQGQVLIRATGAPATAYTPQELETYMTAAQAQALFVKKIGDPGDTVTFVSPNGLAQRIIGCGNDSSGDDSRIG